MNKYNATDPKSSVDPGQTDRLRSKEGMWRGRCVCVRAQAGRQLILTLTWRGRGRETGPG